MFGFISDLTKVVVKTVLVLPVAVAADVLTLGGELTDRHPADDGPTTKALNSISDSFNDLLKD